MFAKKYRNLTFQQFRILILILTKSLDWDITNYIIIKVILLHTNKWKYKMQREKKMEKNNFITLK